LEQQEGAIPMNHLLRWAILVGLVITGFVLGSQVRPELGGNLATWLQIQRQLELERQRGEALDHESRRTRHHL
jgi:hypothetical protein